MSLLEVAHLSKSYPGARRLFGSRPLVPAVEDVSFTIEQGETFALVGESGAGKSTVGRLITRLVPADAGSVVFDGVDLLALEGSKLRSLRRNFQMIFQDPYSSLDPRVTIGLSVAEPLKVHNVMGRPERTAAAAEWLDRVGLGRGFGDRYPRELSGGQLQRACIARALTLQPKLIVCDEPTAALDVSVQAEVINLMHDLQDEYGVAYLFISHNLALVEAIAHRVGVMADRQMVEIGTAADIYRAPSTDYTRRLLSATPVPIPKALRT